MHKVAWMIPNSVNIDPSLFVCTGSSGTRTNLKLSRFAVRNWVLERKILLDTHGFPQTLIITYRRPCRHFCTHPHANIRDTRIIKKSRLLERESRLSRHISRSRLDMSHSRDEKSRWEILRLDGVTSPSIIHPHTQYIHSIRHARVEHRLPAAT